MSSNKWRDVDRAAVCRMRTWMGETSPKTKMADLAELLGWSYAKTVNVMNMRNAPLTMGEYVRVCNFFKKDAATELLSLAEQDCPQGEQGELKAFRDLDNEVNSAVRRCLSTLQREMIPPPRDMRG